MMQRQLIRNVFLASRKASTPLRYKQSPFIRHASSMPSGAPRIANPAVFIAGSLLSGFFGYFIAKFTVSSNVAPGREGFEQKYGSREDFKKAIEELRSTLGAEAVSTDAAVLGPYGYSENDYHPATHHDVVVYPESTNDVSTIVKIAGKYKIPVTPYSGGTSLEGNYRAHSAGGICIDMSGMDKILEIHEADSDLVCQAGARWQDINETLKERGIPLFFPLDPGPGATMGGMASTGGSGTNAVRYGTTKSEWFLNITVVLPNGEIIKTRRRARKSAAGFDLTKLFIGAEGTLGVITEVTVKLAPVLPTSVAVVQFPDVQRATEAVTDILNKGIGIQCIELCDDKFMQATNSYGISKRKWPEKDSLFIKFQGPNEKSLKDHMMIAKSIARTHGALGFEIAKDDKEASDLWNDRKNGHYAALSLIPGCRSVSTDVCVPVSSLPKLVYDTKEDMRVNGITGIVIGHVGDGNFHTSLLFTTEEELVKVKSLADRMVQRAIALDGTCTGEHGVGIGKKKHLYEELGEGTVELMKKIKRTLDPDHILNPGKLYPDPPNSTKS